MIYDDEGIRYCEMGNGDVWVGTAHAEDSNVLRGVAFMDGSGPMEIGTKGPHNESDASVSGTKIMLSFSNPASVDVVINTLNRVRDDLRREQSGEFTTGGDEK